MLNPSKKFLFISIIFTILAVALNAFIIYQSCLGSGESTSWSEPVAEAAATVINTIKPETITPVNMPDFSAFIRKAIGHYGLFGLDGIITTNAFIFTFTGTKIYEKYKLIWISLVVGVFVAFLTEFIQLYTPGRSGEITDALIDSSGYLTSFILILITIYIFKKNTKKLAE